MRSASRRRQENPRSVVLRALGATELRARVWRATFAARAPRRVPVRQTPRRCPHVDTPRSLRPTHGLDSRNKVEKLAKSMRKERYDATKPIDAAEVDGALYITDGHHRAAAAASPKVPVKNVPVRVRQPYSSEEATQLFRDYAGTLDDRGF
ncbi:ParB/RepB/Spo0J family partition protein [Sorangium sp. So ce429]